MADTSSYWVHLARFMKKKMYIRRKADAGNYVYRSSSSKCRSENDSDAELAQTENHSEEGISSQAVLPFFHDPSIPLTSIDNFSDDILAECLKHVRLPDIGSSSRVCQRWRRIIYCNNYWKVRKPYLSSFVAVLSANSTLEDAESCVKIQLYHPSSNRWLSGTFFSPGVNIDDFSSCCTSRHGLYLFDAVIGNQRMNPPLFYDFWSNSASFIGDMITPRMKFTSGEIRGKVYVAGGTKKGFNITEKTKVVGSNGPAESSTTLIPNSDEDSGLNLIENDELNDKVGNSVVPAVKPPRKEWRKTLKNVILKRRSLSSKVMEVRELSSCEAYDPETGSWHEIPGMSMERVSSFGGVMNGKLYVIGGTSTTREASEKCSHSMEVYDPRSNSWSWIEPIPEIGFVLGSVILGHSIFVMRRSRESLSWLRFDSVQNEWSDSHEIPIPPDHRQTRLVKFDCCAISGKIYIIQVWGNKDDMERLEGEAGGLTSTGAFFFEYDPEKEGDFAWKQLVDMPVATRGAVCAGVVC